MSKKTYPNKTKSMIKTAAENKKASSATADAKRKPMRWEQTARLLRDQKRPNFLLLLGKTIACQMRGHAVGRMVQNAEEPTAPTTGCVESLFLQSDPEYSTSFFNSGFISKSGRIINQGGRHHARYSGAYDIHQAAPVVRQQSTSTSEVGFVNGGSGIIIRHYTRAFDYARSGSAHALSDRRDRIRFGGSGHSAWTFRRFDGSATGSVPADFGSGSDNDALGFGTQEGQDESDKQAEDQARSGSGP
ncbi:hypothetical protein R3P38DRAFT_3350627 [Favolaschia claudopus]|uniref:Uncharacterized protein n=1 Tax=Favolaschia claudopus TaxID=2862362 RepID=A0AAW0CBD2_9AGAR